MMQPRRVNSVRKIESKGRVEINTILAFLSLVTHIFYRDRQELELNIGRYSYARAETEWTE